MLRAVTDTEIESFWADGVVCLRSMLEPRRISAMRTPVDGLVDTAELADMTAMGAGLEAAGEAVLREAATGGGRFVSGVDHWRHHDAFRAFATDPELGGVVGAILRADTVRLWEDSVLVKQPRTVEQTAWHQDLSYFHAEGEQVCTTWIPLDAATTESGAMRFVRGSHRWSDLFRPNLFVSTMPIPGTDGAAVPDVDGLAASGEIELVTFDLRPGDLTIHHARTLHAAGGNTTDRPRRAISVRYCGDDVRYRFRPGAPRKPHHQSVRDGDPLATDDTPVVWSRAHAG